MKNSLIKRWKKGLKSKLKELLSWRDQTFFAFGRTELENSLNQLGIKKGDAVFVHSSFDAFRGFHGKPSEVIEIIQNTVGPGGVIMMPTMAFTGTAVEYALNNPLVDIKRTQSRMGLITELFRRSPGVVRSLHPTHPIAVWGADAQHIAADHHLAQTPCGTFSPLSKLLDKNGSLLLLGADFSALTFYHTVEEILEKRLPINPFTDTTYHLRVRDALGQTWDCQTRLYEPRVSRKRRLDGLLNELRRMGAWKERRVGRLRINLTLAKDVLQATENLLDRGISCYD